MGCGSSQAVSVLDNKPLPSKPADGQDADATKSRRSEQGFEMRPAMGVRPSSFQPLIPLSAAPSYQGTIVEFDSGKSSQADFKSGFDLDKVSRCSSMFSDTDSGYLDKEYKHVITEKSEMNVIEKVEKDFSEREGTVALGVSGVACPPLLSDKEREEKASVDDPRSQELLKSSGLALKRPVTAKGKYTTFDLVEAQVQSNLQATKVKLPRILRREKSERPTLTNDDIERKLEKANRRKKENIDLKLTNLRASMNGLPGAKQAAFTGDTESENQSRFGLTKDIIDRQNKLRELRENLRKKKEEEDQNSARTPRDSELDNFRPKTPAAFRSEF